MIPLAQDCDSSLQVRNGANDLRKYIDRFRMATDHLINLGSSSDLNHTKARASINRMRVWIVLEGLSHTD